LHTNLRASLVGQIQGTNLILNPGFEAGGFWQGLTPTNNATNAHSGNYYGQLSGLSTCFQCDENNNGRYIQVQPGDVYLLSAWMYIVSRTSGNIDVTVFTSDKDKTVVGYHGAVANNATIGSWQQISITFTAESNAQYMTPYLELTGTAVARFDDIVLRKVASIDTDVQDGTTYARHLASDMTSNRIDFSKSLLNKGALATKDTAGLDSDVTDGSTYGRLKLTALTSGSIDPSKAGLLAKGGIPPAASGSIAYTSTTSSITWTWTSLVIYRADGTTTNISNGSFTDSSLSASTAYYYYPYYNDTTGAIGWVNGSGHGTNGYSFLNAQRSNTLAQTQNLQAYIPLSAGAITGSTTASGSGGGSGGGGGSCVRSTMLVKEKTKGIVPASEIVAGDYLRNRSGWVKVVFAQLRDHDVFVRVTVNGHSVEVTTTHPFIAMDENCELIPILRAANLTLLNQLFTVEGADFVQGVQVVKVPGGKKMVLQCEADHTFFSGEDMPYILTHNTVPIGT
jgi:hypothetical protein